MGINTAVLAGNLGRDVEKRFLQSGEAVVNFSLAVRGYKDKTLWFEFKAFGKVADVCSDYLSKGASVTVSGRLDIEEWTTQAGEKRSKTVLIVNDLQLPPKADAGTKQQAAMDAYAPPAYMPPDDIPF